MCQPTSRQKDYKHKHVFFEIHSDQASLIKHIHMHMHTPEQQLHNYVEEPLSIRRNRRAISHQLSTELQELVQELAERRAEEIVQERGEEIQERAEEIAQKRAVEIAQELAEEIAQKRAEEIAQQTLRELDHERELFRELRQIERQLRSSNTPVIMREQLCRRHEQLCALLNISDTN